MAAKKSTAKSATEATEKKPRKSSAKAASTKKIAKKVKKEETENAPSSLSFSTGNEDAVPIDEFAAYEARIADLEQTIGKMHVQQLNDRLSWMRCIRSICKGLALIGVSAEDFASIVASEGQKAGTNNA